MAIRDQVIRIWMIVYDGDADRVYSFINFDKALASIDGSIRSYYGEIDADEDLDFDDVCTQVTNKMTELRDAPCIPMQFNNLHIVVYSWEIDYTNPIHKVLVDCYTAVDDLGLKNRIGDLFSCSVR